MLYGDSGLCIVLNLKVYGVCVCSAAAASGY